MSRDEINRFLAEKVMGWRIVNVSTKPYDAAYTPAYDTWVNENNITCVSPAFAWNPYDNIAQAMMVVDKLAVPMAMYRENIGNGWYWVVRMNKGAEFFDDFLSCAICMAALKVVEK